jgi:ABC-type multidrug transport system fused ATPase/permease subunit
MDLGGRTDRGRGDREAVSAAMRRAGRWAVWGGVLGLTAAAAEVGLALALGVLATRVAGGGGAGPAIGALAACAAVRIVAQVGIGLAGTLAHVEASRELRGRGLDEILRADAASMEPAASALTRWLEHAPRVGQARQAAVILAALGVQAALLAALVVHLSPVLGLAMIGVLGATGALAWLAARRVRAVAADLAPAQRRVAAALERATRNVLVVRALGTEDVERGRLAAHVDAHAALQRRVAWRNAIAGASPLVPGVVAIATLAAVGLELGLEAAPLVAMLYALVRLASVLAGAGAAVAAIAASGPAAAAIAAERGPPSPRRVPEDARPCAIAIEDAAAEAGGRRVLAGVSFDVAAGEVVGIAGPSGSGKTTLLRLVLGLVEPSLGRVRLDGEEPAVWIAARRVGLVGPEPFLFAGTIRDNVAYGADLDDDDVREALERARASHLALDRPVGEGGEGLSSGERQRVALARAIAARPSLLVLDDATSDLDAVLEAEIAELVRSLAGGTTVLVAAHRPTLLRVCDRILDVVPGHGGSRVTPRPSAAREAVA